MCRGGFRRTSCGSVFSARGYGIPFCFGPSLFNTSSPDCWLVGASSLSTVDAVTGVVIGLMYYKIDDSLNFGVTDRYSSQFFILAAMMFIPPFAAVILWDSERKLLKVESNRKSYSILCYFLAKTGTTWPMEIFLSLTLALICYWMVGKDTSYGIFFKRRRCFVVCRVSTWL